MQDDRQIGLLYQETSPFQTAMGETAESRMGEKKACLGQEMKRNDGRGERFDRYLLDALDL